MRILLDESVPRRLARLIAGHDVTTVVAHGWAGMRNGELLERASAEFDVFVSRFPLAVVILDAPTNSLEDLRPLVPQLLRTLDERPPSPTVIAR